MQGIPLKDVPERPPRKLALDHSAFDLDRDFEVLLRVEMRWAVLAMVHGDHDAQEPRDLRHRRNVPKTIARPPAPLPKPTAPEVLHICSGTTPSAVVRI